MSQDTLIIELLNSQPFLYGVPISYLPKIADCAELETFAQGDFLVRQHQPAEKFYFVLQGSVSLQMQVHGHQPLTIDTVKAKAVLGWSWLMPPNKWHFDAIALEQTRVITVHTPQILEKINNDKEFGFEIYKRFFEIVVDRLHCTNIQAFNVAPKTKLEAS